MRRRLSETQREKKICFYQGYWWCFSYVSIRSHNDPLFVLLLTKMDSDARGGAALSIRQVTGVPIKFVGTGEKIDGLEAFHPDRMASRILGMGDVLSLIEKAEQAFEQEQMDRMEKRLRSAAFTFEDFLEQLHAVRQMGPLDQLVGIGTGL